MNPPDQHEPTPAPGARRPDHRGARPLVIRPAAMFVVAPVPAAGPSVIRLRALCILNDTTFHVEPAPDVVLPELVGLVVAIHERDCGRCDTSGIAQLALPTDAALVVQEGRWLGTEMRN